MNEARDIFQQSLKDFKSRLKPEEQAKFAKVTRHDLYTEILSIQEKQRNTKQMQNMNRIKRFLEGVDQLTKVVDVFLNTTEFVGFIYGPIKFMLLAAQTWTNSFDILLGAYEKIGERFPQIQEYEWLFGHNSRMNALLGYIYTDILDFHRKALRIFEGPRWRQIFRAVWKTFQTDFESILCSLQSHSDFISEQAHLIFFQKYQADSGKIMEHIRSYEQDRLINMHKIQMIYEAEQLRSFKAVIEWIAGPQVVHVHESHQETRKECPGSGEWILKHRVIQDWIYSEPPLSSIVWMNGIPGAGKTILASRIIDDCLSHPGYITTCFYCNSLDDQKNTGISIFKGLLSQMITQNHDLIPYFMERMSRSEVTLTSVEQIKNLLELSFLQMPKHYVIIDGLDECNPREINLILSTINDCVEKCDTLDPGKLRVLFVSQDLPVIGNGLRTATRLSLQDGDNEDDMKAFIKKRAIEIQARHGLSREQGEDIERKTCAEAKGMFLYAKLVMENLFAQPTQGAVIEEIQTGRFPIGLGEAYERIMGRIRRDTENKPGQWEVAQKLLGWMVCAKRTLKWQEIQGAISIDLEEETVDIERLKLRIHIRDICGSLVKLLPGDHIELVHSTAKKFILSSNYIHETLVHYSLTIRCLGYLSFECFSIEDENALTNDILAGYFIFQDYAVAEWTRHVEELVKFGPSLISDLSNQQICQDEFHDILQGFTGLYLDDDCSRHQSMGQPDEIDELLPFQCCLFYQDLTDLWRHIVHHRAKGPQERNKISLERLAQSLATIRKLIESLASERSPLSADNRVRLKSLYGEKVYKCTKVRCPYFYEGFIDEKTRKQHVDRHERPYICTVLDCSIADFGFASEKDLNKHTKQYHPEICDQKRSFKEAPSTPKVRKWICPKCDKAFTRNSILRNHILAHDGVREHACKHCGRAFTRLYDCERHEKIHARRGH